MIIKLKGELDFDLTRIGLKPGDIIKNASLDSVSLMGAVNFSQGYQGMYYDCVVWPEDYDVINWDKPVKKIKFTIT
jgi:hypothetical protein